MTSALFDSRAAAAPSIFYYFKNSFRECSRTNFTNGAEFEDISWMDFRIDPLGRRAALT